MLKTNTSGNKNTFSAELITKYWRNQQAPQIGQKFVDPEFPPEFRSLAGLNKDGTVIDQSVYDKKKKDIESYKSMEWKRIDEILPGALIFEDKIEFSDVKQGGIGNCYFLSSMSALAEMPSFIHQIFRTKNKNDDGFFEVVLFIDGEWQIVVVDDYFVVKGETFQFAKPNGQELWAIILEKAWAKVNGGYANTITGYASEALNALSGFSSDKVYYENDNIDADQAWKMIVEADRSDNIMCTSTKHNAGVEEFNLVEGHAYTLIGAKEGTFDGERIRLCKIRNPWGYKEWKGAYSDESKLWTPEKKKYFGFEESADDGSFFMKLEDYMKYYSCVHTCHIQFNCNIKSFKIEANDEFTDNGLEVPHVYNLYLQEEAKISIDAIFRGWRFNRDAKDAKHPASLVIAKYNSAGEFENVDGEYKSDVDVSLTRTLKPGFYVVWIYCSYSDCSSPKHNSFILRFSSPSNYRVRKMGVDTSDFELIKKMIVHGAKQEFKEDYDKAGNAFFKSQNMFKTTGIGYKMSQMKVSNKYEEWKEFDTAQLDNITLFPPFTGANKFDLIVPPNDYAIVLGLRRSQWGTYWFKITQAGYKMKNADEFEGKHADQGQLEELCTEDVRNDEIDFLYYDYCSESLKESHKHLQFEDVDESLIERETLEKKHPEDMEQVLVFQAHEKIPEEGLKWCHYKYNGGHYTGQFRGNKREGRGKYTWDDGSYYVGYWIDSVKDIRGEFGKNGKVNYQGDMVQNKKKGHGTGYHDNGDEYEGEYENDQKHGPGQYWWAAGPSWTGNWVKGKMHGMGKYEDADGNVRDAELNMGKWV